MKNIVNDVFENEYGEKIHPGESVLIVTSGPTIRKGTYLGYMFTEQGYYSKKIKRVVVKYNTTRNVYIDKTTGVKVYSYMKIYKNIDQYKSQREPYERVSYLWNNSIYSK